MINKESRSVKKCVSEFNEVQNILLTKHYGIVRNVVNSMRSRLPSHADLDELHSVGLSGLVNAVSNYDTSRANTFAAYACLRVRGAIIDELRKMDYMPRSARAEAKNIEKISTNLEQKLGRCPNDEEIRSQLGISLKKYTKMRARTQSISFISLNNQLNIGESSLSLSEIIEDENAINARISIESKETFIILRERIKNLPEKQKIVLDLYYFQEKRLVEIAQVLHLTEARICQIHSAALKSLKSKLN